MKKIAIILLVLLSSCTLDNADNLTIGSVLALNDGRCEYHIKDTDLYLVDECNAFQIGDQIKFVKKEE